MYWIVKIIGKNETTQRNKNEKYSIKDMEGNSKNLLLVFVKKGGKISWTIILPFFPITIKK